MFTEALDKWLNIVNIYLQYNFHTSFVLFWNAPLSLAWNVTYFFSEILILFIRILRKQPSVETIVVVVFLHNVNPLEEVAQTNFSSQFSGFVKHAAITQKLVLKTITLSK